MSREAAIGVVSTLAAVALAVYAVLGGPNVQQHQVDTLPYVIGFVVAIAAIVFGLVVPWAKRRGQGNRPATAGLVSSVFGFLTVVAFWSGLPLILGGAGIALGLEGQDRSAAAGRPGLARTAMVVGALAVVLSVGITVLDHMTQ